MTIVEGLDEEADGNAALVPLRLEHTYAAKKGVSGRHFASLCGSHITYSL